MKGGRPSLISTVTGSPVERIYIHFLDYYHEARARKNFSISNETIFREALFGFRIALIFADELVIPASSYFESRLCRRMLRLHSGFVETGDIAISATEPSLVEHRQQKESQYGSASPTGLQDSYRRRPAQVPPRYIRRTGRSTPLIRRQWLGALDGPDIRRQLDPEGELELPADVEVLWSQVPELLAGQAFIPDHVLNIFQVRGTKAITRNHFEGIIEGAYTAGYARSLGAALMTEMIYLESPFQTPEDIIRIPYRRISRALSALDLRSPLIAAEPRALIRMRSLPTWTALANIILDGRHESSADETAAQECREILRETSTPRVQFNSSPRDSSRMRSGGLTDEEINALAEAFSTPLTATQLLERAGWPRSSHPLWGAGSALTFWREVSAQLKAGVIADGSARVLRVAQEQFPASSVFGTIGRGSERRRPPGDSAGSGDRRSISRSS